MRSKVGFQWAGIMGILVVFAVAMLLCAKPAYAAAPLWQVSSQVGTFTYGTTTVKHQTGMETMTLSSTEHLATGWCYSVL